MWSKTLGQTSTKTNMILACFNALQKLSETKIREQDVAELNIVDGAVSEVPVDDKNE
jgi:ribosomal protein S5